MDEKDSISFKVVNFVLYFINPYIVFNICVRFDNKTLLHLHLANDRKQKYPMINLISVRMIYE